MLEMILHLCTLIMGTGIIAIIYMAALEEDDAKNGENQEPVKIGGITRAR